MVVHMVNVWTYPGNMVIFQFISNLVNSFYREIATIDCGIPIDLGIAHNYYFDCGSAQYPLVNFHLTMEDHFLLWKNSPVLWPCSIAMLDYWRVCR